MTIYVLKQYDQTDQVVADADISVVEWSVIARVPKKIFIHMDARREKSRWVSTDRKFPYCVRYSTRSSNSWGSAMSHHRTLEAAIKAARQLAKHIMELVS